MKFWRRHKHEFTRAETDDPLPQPPEKKMRYSREDDILLAKYFFDKPEGTSDKVFQAFGRTVRSVSPLCLSLLRKVDLLISNSIRIIHGKGGKNITVYIKQKSIISYSCSQMAKI
jgi:hypothetical protein